MEPDVMGLVYKPEQVARYTQNIMEDRMMDQHRVLKTGITNLDGYLHGLMPGEMMVVLGNTGQYKTGFMQFMARHVVTQLKMWPTTDKKPVVVYCSWENLVEQLGYYDMMSMSGLQAESAWYGSLSDDDLITFNAARKAREVMDLWLVGRSLTRRTETVQMTIENVERALVATTQKYSVFPAIIFLDYLQEIPGPGSDMRERTMNNVGRAKEMGLRLGCPIVMAAQAGRAVLERDWKMPQLHDCMESARIEQAADKVIGLWYPCKTEPKKATIEKLGYLPVNDSVLLAAILKNRFGRTLSEVVLEVDPAHNVIREPALRTEQLK